MTAHPRTGLGTDTTQDDFDEAGRAELVRLIIWDLTTSGNAKDPATAQQWFMRRPRIDQAMRRQVLQTLFPPRARRTRRPALSACAALA